MPKTATTQLLRISPEQLDRYYEAMTLARGVNTLNIMEAHVRAEEEWEQKSHYASRIIQCPRAHWYGLKGVKRSNPFTLTQAMKFALGSAVGDIVGDRLEGGMRLIDQRRAGSPLPRILEAADRWSPQLHEDICAAIERKAAEPEKMAQFEIGDFTVIELPFRIKVPGFAFPIGGRIDCAYVTPDGFPMIVELKSSSARMTQMVKDQQTTLPNYLLQAYSYMQRYGLPTELDYFDREWGYPYRFGLIQSMDGHVYFQPGGIGRLGKAMAAILNGMHPADFILARLEWYEELLKSDQPPGEIRWGVIPSPRGKTKEFYGAGLAGLTDHPTYLGKDEEAYRLYYEADGSIVEKRQAENVEYKTGICGKYCGYRDMCMASGGVELRPEPPTDFSAWGAPVEEAQQ